MDIGLIRGATRVLGKAQGYLGLPVRDEAIECSVNGSGTAAMVTEWRPTEAEVAALAEGGVIQVRILGQSHPPIMVGVAAAEDAGATYAQAADA